jgi:hypothetical protein
MMSVHAESDVPRVAVEELLWNAQPLRCVDKPIVPLGECCAIEGCILQVHPRMSGSNIFARHPLSVSANDLPTGGFHLSIVNSINKYPYVKVSPFS